MTDCRAPGSMDPGARFHSEGGFAASYRLYSQIYLLKIMVVLRRRTDDPRMG